MRNGRNTPRFKAWFNLIFAMSYLCRKYCKRNLWQKYAHFWKGQNNLWKAQIEIAKMKKGWIRIWDSVECSIHSPEVFSHTCTAADRAHSCSFTVAASPSVHWRATSKSAEKCKQKPWTLVGKGVTPSITWKNLSNGSRQQIQIFSPFYHNVVFIPHTMWLSLGEVLSDWQLLKKW